MDGSHPQERLADPLTDVPRFSRWRNRPVLNPSRWVIGWHPDSLFGRLPEHDFLASPRSRIVLRGRNDCWFFDDPPPPSCVLSQKREERANNKGKPMTAASNAVLTSGSSRWLILGMSWKRLDGATSSVSP